MKLQIFAVYDSKAKAYLPPFFLPEIGQATRVFQNASDDPSHAFGANPADYCLFHIGVFDDSSATIKAKTPPESLGLAQEFKTRQETAGMNNSELPSDHPLHVVSQNENEARN